MTVKLSVRAEQLVREQVKAGRYSSPEEMVNRIMEDCLDAADFVDPAVEAALLEALDSPRHVFVADEFMERARLRASEHMAELCDDKELEATLLASINSPRHVYRKGTFGEMARKWLA